MYIYVRIIVQIHFFGIRSRQNEVNSINKREAHAYTYTHLRSYLTSRQALSYAIQVQALLSPLNLTKQPISCFMLGMAIACGISFISSLTRVFKHTYVHIYTHTYAYMLSAAAAWLQCTTSSPLLATLTSTTYRCWWQPTFTILLLLLLLLLFFLLLFILLYLLFLLLFRRCYAAHSVAKCCGAIWASRSLHRRIHLAVAERQAVQTFEWHSP